jgi:uncharacterized protein YcbK (DUF882 family)
MMDKKSYIRKMRHHLDLLDIRHFSPLELCLVGRTNSEGTKLQAPPLSMFENIYPTIVRIETVRRILDEPIIVNSGYRDPEYNAGVSEASGSLHVFFNALDVRLASGNTYKLYKALDELPNSDKFGLMEYRNFVHFDTRGILEPGRRGWRKNANS